MSVLRRELKEHLDSERLAPLIARFLLITLADPEMKIEHRLRASEILLLAMEFDPLKNI